MEESYTGFLSVRAEANHRAYNTTECGVCEVRGEAEESVERLVAQSDDNLNIMLPVVLVCNRKTKWTGIAQSV
jgi:malonyl CoA-acyl carrier protein transacylase